MIGWTLGRYFFIRYVQITFYFLLGIFALSLLLDFTENASKLSNLPDYSVWAALGLSAMRVPFIMQQMIPFVALFSAMATLISLNRKYELVVARSVGVSAWQFLLPACFGAFLFGLATIFILNPFAAYGFAKADEIASTWKTGKTTDVSALRDPWLRQRPMKARPSSARKAFWIRARRWPTRLSSSSMRKRTSGNVSTRAGRSSGTVTGNLPT